MKFWNAGAAAICWQTFTISAEPKDTEQGVGGNGGLCVYRGVRHGFDELGLDVI